MSAGGHINYTYIWEITKHHLNPFLQTYAAQHQSPLLMTKSKVEKRRADTTLTKTIRPKLFRGVLNNIKVNTALHIWRNKSKNQNQDSKILNFVECNQYLFCSILQCLEVLNSTWSECSKFACYFVGSIKKRAYMNIL